jgi:hypothetical protein
LCHTEARGRRHWLVATYRDGAAMYANLCTPCYRRALAAVATQAAQPRWRGGEVEEDGEAGPAVDGGGDDPAQ